MKTIKIALCLLLTLAGFKAIEAQKSQSNIKKLLNAEFAVDKFYVDSVDENKLVEDAIKGMLEKLDPHSSYTNAKETKALTEPLQGEFSGIGVQFNIRKDTLYVVQTIPGGPSERVGILPGDRIVTVNDTAISGVKMKNSDIQRRLRGKKGTKVRVKIKRGTGAELINFVITRDKIPLYSVDAGYMLDSITGYVRISSFGAKTYDEMMQALDRLQKQGMKQVVIDLSDNGGGYMNAAIEMVNEFLDGGQMIVYTESSKMPRNEAHAYGNGRYRDLKMAIIVSQYSASASEIFTGAMQDWDRAVVVGRRTFGKGLVQRPFEFEDGSMMRLTVARYHTPSGRCIQKPYTKGDRKDYEDDIVKRAKEGEYYNIDSIQFNDSLKYSTLKNHRTIYGGGGIMPDIFVPVDTSEYSTYYRDMLAKGIIYQYSLDYIDRNRKSLKKLYPTVEQFARLFQLSDADMKAFVEAGEKEKVKFNESQYKTSEQVFRTFIKGIIGRDLYNDRSAYSRIVNHRNRDLKAALKVLYDEAEFNNLLQHGNPEYDKIAARHKQAQKK